jgi:Tol biopolymer transport system component
MGEVYRATDSRLSRDVAIKVLPDEVATDPDRLARFQREAKLLASLNHPHIAAIHGFEEVEGTRFLVLELVEGEDLSARLARGPLPVDEALEIAKQIAEALAEAHEKGIVHRDLKPGNVKLTPEGKAKVLDFGLAKAWSGDPGTASGSSADLSQSPTLAHSGTQAGLILGTAAYMSPEQARGQAVDKRADIWAFGVVLLEMLTGKNTFSDSTVSDTLASVLKSAPDLGALPPEVPPNVRRALERCLRKDPKERTRDIGDVLLDLSEKAGEPEPLPAQVKHPAWRGATGWVALGAAIGGMLVGGLSWFLRGAESRRPGATPIVRLEVAAPPGTTLERGLAISPDGSRIAFVARDERGRNAVWVRALESLEARRLPGTEGGWLPFWSPDGQSLGFFAGGRLLRVDLVGGPPREVAHTDIGAQTRGGAWSPDGTIVFAGSIIGALERAPADGGAPPQPATELQGEQGTHRFPHFLPDGRHFTFYASAASGVEPGELRLGELGSFETRRLTEASSTAVYVPTGHLVFARGDTILARPFDVGRLAFTGEPVPVGIEIPTGSSISGLRSLSVSRAGTLAYRVDPSSVTDLVWVDREGRELGTIDDAAYWQLAPRISPDGRRILVGRHGAGSVGNLWVLDAERGVGTPLTFGAADDTTAVWSPDGRRLAYSRATSQNTFNLHVMEIDDPESTRPLVALGVSAWLSPNSWTPDGRLLFERRDLETGIDILAVATTGEAQPEEWLATAFNEWGAEVSPDGRWVAYISDIGSVANVYVKPLDGPGAPWQVSLEGGTSPCWSPGGDELFYRSITNEIVSAAISAGKGQFSTGAPVALFDAGIIGVWRDYDVTPDGRRFLLNRPADTGDAPLVVVLGFGQALEAGAR